MENLIYQMMKIIFDKMKEYGVKFAMEPHPNNIVYDLHTAKRAVELLEGHPCWGYNLDPANLMATGGVNPIYILFLYYLATVILEVLDACGVMLDVSVGSGTLGASEYDDLPALAELGVLGDYPIERYLPVDSVNGRFG